ncbi:MAG: RRQRL motif-containing zinc-binding protein [Dermatophilaceae bacterium]
MTPAPTTNNRPDAAASRRAVLACGTGTTAGITPGGAPATADTFTGFRWGLAPAGLATRRQLADRALRPGTTEPVARIVWRRGRRHADLYRLTDARPKNRPTPAQLAALTAARRARSTCTSCGHVADYCLPTRNGRRCPTCDPATYGEPGAA